MSANAITVKDVTKVYRLYDKPIDRLKESLSPTHKSYHKDFYALNGLSFNVEKGQTVGIIGTNGSGKSTILKIITGVLTPTTGQVDVEGKISALLELGAGFNMDYTGIENIYMNGTMMGYSRKEMDEKLQSGYWNLFRFNPAAEGKKFSLDCKPATVDYQEFIKGEVRYTSLALKNPARAEKLFAKAEQNAKDKYAYLEKLVTLYDEK